MGLLDIIEAVGIIAGSIFLVSTSYRDIISHFNRYKK